VLPQGSARPSPRLLYVGLVALAVRLAYLVEHLRSPLFAYPVLDALYHDTVARRLAVGESVAAIDPGFRPLLYPWLLSRLYRMAPESGLALAIVAQHLVGVGSTLLVVWIAFRLSGSNRVAAAAGLLFAFAGVPLYFEGELLLTGLATFLLLALVAVSVGLSDGGRRVGWLAPGALLGLAAQLRPNALLLALAFPLAPLFGGRPRRAWLPPAVALAGLLATLALFGVLQQSSFGRFQLLPGAGGVNFYLGNKRGADGMIPRQDREVSYGAEYRDSVERFAREEYARQAGRVVEEAEAPAISRYWGRRGLAEIAAAPGAWLVLEARKLRYLLWNGEIPNNRDYAFVLREESRLLRWLPVRWWLLLALAPVGFVCLRQRGRSERLYWLVAYLLGWAAGLLLYFVNGRYRAPLWPLLCVLAGAGGARLAEHLRRRDLGRLAREGGAAVAVAALSLAPWPRVELPSLARDYFYRSAAWLERGESERSLADARRAVELDPGDAVHHFQLGSALLARGEPAAAVDSFERAIERKPDEPRAWNGRGAALEQVGREVEALASYLRAGPLAGGFAPAWVNAALLELRAGLVDEAAGHLEAAERMEDDSPAYLCARGLLLRARGEAGEAERWLALARRRAPEMVSRLEGESREPVDLGGS
jgi:tetratricopeptide (TPR) repeat protein